MKKGIKTSLDIQKGMNPFAAGMSMFVSLLSALTLIGQPVEGLGIIPVKTPKTRLLKKPILNRL